MSFPGLVEERIQAPRETPGTSPRSIGAILAACGLFLRPEANSGPALGANIALVWGLVQIAFGAVMLALAKSAAGKKGGKP